MLNAASRELGSINGRSVEAHWGQGVDTAVMADASPGSLPILLKPQLFCVMTKSSASCFQAIWGRQRYILLEILIISSIFEGDLCMRR